MTGSDLAALQLWMQRRVTAGLWPVERDESGIGHVVVASAALPAAARLGIYASSYVARLAECMRLEFPVLRALIGEQVFNLFVGGYLSARPPESFSLYDLGAGFADYLEATRPSPRSGPAAPEALPANLARLERALAEAERADGPEDAAGDLNVPSVLCDPRRRLHLPGSVKLLRLDFDFTATLATAREGERPVMPVPGNTLMAVARARYRVRAHRLDPWAFAWLSALEGNGGDVQAAIQVASRVSGRDGGAIVADLLLWLPLAVQNGFIV